jgi:hypothetical protein
VEFFVVGRRVSGSADDQAVSSRLGDFNQDNLGVVAAQDAFNPVEQPGEKCKLSPVTRVALGAVRRKKMWLFVTFRPGRVRVRHGSRRNAEQISMNKMNNRNLGHNRDWAFQSGLVLYDR